MALRDIQEQLGPNSGVKPGSPEERQLLEQARALNSHETNEFRVVRNGVLRAEGQQDGVVDPAGAQHASELAMEHITSEHAALPPSPDQPQQPAIH